MPMNDGASLGSPPLPGTMAGRPGPPGHLSQGLSGLTSPQALIYTWWAAMIRDYFKIWPKLP